MQKFIFLSLTVVVCMARPNVQHFNSNEYQQAKQKSTNFANTDFTFQKPATSLAAISKYQHQLPYAQIESIKPSIHLASFTVQTTVPLSQLNAGEPQTYTQRDEPAKQQSHQFNQALSDGSFSVGTFPPVSTNYGSAPISTVTHTHANSPVQSTYSYSPATTQPQRYETYPTTYPENSLQSYVPTAPTKQNSTRTYLPPVPAKQHFPIFNQEQYLALQATLSPNYFSLQPNAVKQTNAPYNRNQQSENSTQITAQAYVPVRELAPTAPQQHQTSYSALQPATPTQHTYLPPKPAQIDAPVTQTTTSTHEVPYSSAQAVTPTQQTNLPSTAHNTIQTVSYNQAPLNTLTHNEQPTSIPPNGFNNYNSNVHFNYAPPKDEQQHFSTLQHSQTQAPATENAYNFRTALTSASVPQTYTASISSPAQSYQSAKISESIFNYRAPNTATQTFIDSSQQIKTTPIHTAPQHIPQTVNNQNDAASTQNTYHHIQSVPAKIEEQQPTPRIAQSYSNASAPTVNSYNINPQYKYSYNYNSQAPIQTQLAQVQSVPKATLPTNSVSHAEVAPDNLAALVHTTQDIGSYNNKAPKLVEQESFYPSNQSRTSLTLKIAHDPRFAATQSLDSNFASASNPTSFEARFPVTTGYAENAGYDSRRY